MKRAIYWVNEDGPAKEGYLDYGEGWDIAAMIAAGEAMPDTDAPPSLEEFAEMCDREAEGRNNHAFVGAHRMLAAILHQQVGRDTARAIMRAVVQYGGLDYASGAGCGSDEDAWADFGLKEPWHDWKLTP